MKNKIEKYWMEYLETNNKSYIKALRKLNPDNWKTVALHALRKLEDTYDFAKFVEQKTAQAIFDEIEKIGVGKFNHVIHIENFKELKKCWGCK